ncbi:MAG: hypothetical protein IPH23_14925 [Gammaproteobacteria bacterium]|nr:hypothetical protein [Gammaproteobacteria bacterium]
MITWERGCPEIDLTRRPEDDLVAVGVLLRQRARPAATVADPPAHPGAGVRHRVTEISSTALCYRADAAADLTAFARVRSAAGRSVECWTITFENPGNSPRRLRLASFQELTLGDAEAASRHPAFNAPARRHPVCGARQPPVGLQPTGDGRARPACERSGVSCGGDRRSWRAGGLRGQPQPLRSVPEAWRARTGWHRMRREAPDDGACCPQLRSHCH